MRSPDPPRRLRCLSFCPCLVVHLLRSLSFLRFLSFIISFFLSLSCYHIRGLCRFRAGIIPPELGNLASLTQLHLSNGDLIGGLPMKNCLDPGCRAPFFLISWFLFLFSRLYCCCRCCCCHRCSCTSAMFHVLMMMSNPLCLWRLNDARSLARSLASGPIPSSFGDLGALKVLRLQSNSLAGKENPGLDR